MLCVSELPPPFEPSGFRTPMPPPASIPKLRMSRMCLCMNASFGRPTCSQTTTCAFSNSNVAPSRGNCGGHFFDAALSACATAMAATPTTIARAQMPRTPARRRLKHFTRHLQKWIRACPSRFAEPMSELHFGRDRSTGCTNHDLTNRTPVVLLLPRYSLLQARQHLLVQLVVDREPLGIRRFFDLANDHRRGARAAERWPARQAFAVWIARPGEVHPIRRHPFGERAL